MALIGFPDQIKVKLGSNFVGGGNGLNSGDDLVMSKVLGDEVWTEDGTDVPKSGPSDPNRLKLHYQTGNPVVTLQNQNTAFTSFWRTLAIASFSPVLDYNFLAIWNKTFATTSSPMGAFIYSETQAAASWGGVATSRTGTNWTSVITPLWRGETFTLFEEFVESRAPDKTAYRYG